MTDELRLSPSKLDMLSKCGVQYEYRYVKGLKIPPSVGMLEGRAIDKAASAILRHKLAEGTLPTDEAVADHAGQEMRTEWNDAGEVLIPAAEALRGGKGRLGYAVDRAIRMARKYRTAVAPYAQTMVDPKTGIARVQHKWEVDMGSGIVLNGISDDEETDAVNDLKTKGKPAPDRAAHESPQLTGYAAAKYVIDGIEEPKVRLHVLIDRPKLFEGTVPGDDPAGVKFQRLESVRTLEQMQAYLRRVEQAAKVIRAGAFLPARPEDWWCSAKFCGYFQICPYAHKPVSIAQSCQPNSEYADSAEGRSDEHSDGSDGATNA